MRIDWNNKDSFKRLLAAMVAAQDMKLNYTKIATMYGQGATYDAIEGHFRKIRKEATQLREEYDARAAGAPFSSTPVPEVPRKPRAKRTSKKGKAEAGPAVLGGRVKKNAAAAKRGKMIKEEAAEEERDAVGDTDAETDNFGSQGGSSAAISFDTNEDMFFSNECSFVYDIGI